MSDLISRQAAIDTICRVCQGTFLPCESFPCDEIEALKALPSVQQGQQWIPVSERLPETDGYYLVTIKTFGWNGEQYEDVDIARYERKNGWLKADKCIAWMPLIEPYKGEES